MTAVKNYLVDSFVADKAIKAPCKAVSITNITLSGEQTVNGVAVVKDDRVLVTAQTDPTENGIYDASTADWTRAADWDGNRDVADGTLVSVATANIGRNPLYQCNATEPVVVGTSAVTFTLADGPNVSYPFDDVIEGGAGLTEDDIDDSYVLTDVRRYGALLDGATDDQGAVTDALAVLSQLGGGILRFPDDADSIALTSVSVPDKCSIDGRMITVVPLSTPTQVFLVPSASGDRRDNIKIENFTLGGDCTNFVRITGSYWQNVEVDNIVVNSGTTGTAIVKTEITAAVNPDHLRITRIDCNVAGWKYGWYGTGAASSNVISSVYVDRIYLWPAASGWPVRVEHKLQGSIWIDNLYHGAGSGTGGGVLYVAQVVDGRIGKLWSEASNGDIVVVGGSYQNVTFDLLQAQTDTSTESDDTQLINAHMFNCEVFSLHFVDDNESGFERDDSPPASYKTLIFVNDASAHISRDVRIHNAKGNFNYSHVTDATGQGVRLVSKPGDGLIYADFSETTYTTSTTNITSTPGNNFLTFSNWEWGYDEEAIEIEIHGEWIGTNAKDIRFYIEDATHELFRLDETGAGAFIGRALVRAHNDGADRLWVDGYSIHQSLLDQRTNNAGNTWARTDTRTSLLYVFASTMNAADSFEIHSIVIRPLRSTTR